MTARWENERIAKEAARIETAEHRLLSEYDHLRRNAEELGMETETAYSIDPPFGAYAGGEGQQPRSDAASDEDEQEG